MSSHAMWRQMIQPTKSGLKLLKGLERGREGDKARQREREREKERERDTHTEKDTEKLVSLEIPTKT